MQHPGESPRSVRPTRDPKDADLVTWTVVILHEEPVATTDVLVQVPCLYRLVHDLGDPLEERLDGAWLEIGCYPGLVWRIV